MGEYCGLSNAGETKARVGADRIFVTDISARYDRTIGNAIATDTCIHNNCMSNSNGALAAFADSGWRPFIFDLRLDSALDCVLPVVVVRWHGMLMENGVSEV